MKRLALACAMMLAGCGGGDEFRAEPSAADSAPDLLVDGAPGSPDGPADAAPDVTSETAPEAGGEIEPEAGPEPAPEAGPDAGGVVCGSAVCGSRVCLTNTTPPTQIDMPGCCKEPDVCGYIVMQVNCKTADEIAGLGFTCTPD